MAGTNAGFCFGKCTNADVYSGKRTISFINACKGRLKEVLLALLVPVVGGVPLIGDGAVVHLAGVEPLELPAVVVRCGWRMVEQDLLL